MLLARLPQPFDHPGWIFELKHDGRRALAHVADRRCELVSRNGSTLGAFPALCADLAAAVPGSAVLDGEVVHLGSDGRPLFMDLMRRRGNQHFYAFDLVWLNGRDLRGLPLLR